MPEIQNLQLNNAVNSQARKLWFAAKRNFYYRDDPSRAALLCKQIIAQSALSEEADEAKLLLHDSRIEIRKLVGGSGKRTVRPAVLVRAKEQVRATTATAGMKITVATAVVALPIIGIAQDGIIGIALPELAALVMMGSLFWLCSRVRNLVKNQDLPQRSQRARR